MSLPDSAHPPRHALSNLQLRVISGVVLGVAAAAETWMGGVWFELFAVAIGVAIFIEWCAITRVRSNGGHQLISALLFAGALVAALAGWSPPVAAIAIGALLCLAAGLLLGQWQWTLAGFVYAGLSAVSLAVIRGDDRQGLLAILMLFAVVWATDIMAYFVGRTFKGPKLAPAISPGKTWSGAFGGAAFGVIAGVLAAWWSGIGEPVRIGILALVLSTVSQAGDLFESWIKRRFGVKDSSRIIPGHGGVMDRVDGLVAAAMALYVAGILLGRADDPVGWMFQRTAGL